MNQKFEESPRTHFHRLLGDLANLKVTLDGILYHQQTISKADGLILRDEALKFVNKVEQVVDKL